MTQAQTVDPADPRQVTTPTPAGAADPFGATSRAAEPTADDIVQLVRPDGTPRQQGSHRVLVGDEDARAMLREMVLGRRLDLEATNLQRQNELGMWPPMWGQEGTQIGVGWALRGADHVYPSYREHALALNRGVDPVALMALFRGVSNGIWDFDGLGFEGYTLVVGAQVLHAVGHAMARQLDAGSAPDAELPATVVFHGDGATSQGEVNEGYVFAATYQAPVVFVCQNNHWAISEPVARQSRVPLVRRAEGVGMPGVRVDGNDALAVQAVMTQALERARAGGGPTLVEAVTYRMGAHTTSDDPRRYRTQDEVDVWAGRDPIERLRLYLAGRDALDEQWWQQVAAEADDFGTDIRTRVRALANPDFSASFAHVYSAPDDHLARQLADHRALQATFEEGAR